MAVTRLQLSKYYHEVRSSLPCKHAEKRKILSDLKQNINAYITEDPDASLYEITDQFGTPGQITASYLEEMDQDKLVSNLRIKRKIFGIFVATVAFVLILFTLTMTLITVYDWSIENGYYETEFGTPTYSED